MKTNIVSVIHFLYNFFHFSACLCFYTQCFFLLQKVSLFIFLFLFNHHFGRVFSFFLYPDHFSFFIIVVYFLPHLFFIIAILSLLSVHYGQFFPPLSLIVPFSILSGHFFFFSLSSSKSFFSFFFSLIHGRFFSFIFIFLTVGFFLVHMIVFCFFFLLLFFFLFLTIGLISSP